MSHSEKIAARKLQIAHFAFSDDSIFDKRPREVFLEQIGSFNLRGQQYVDEKQRKYPHVLFHVFHVV